MSKRGRHNEKRRKAARERRAVHHHQPADRPGIRGSEEEPELLQTVRRALASGRAVDVLSTASSLLTVVDPRQRAPFGVQEPTVDREHFLASFVDIVQPETTALLLAYAALLEGSDELTAHRLRKEARRRGHRMPAWLEGLD